MIALFDRQLAGSRSRARSRSRSWDERTHRYLALFPPGEVVEFPAVGLDVPRRRAAQRRPADDLPAPGRQRVGHGATREEARTGALGEMAEMALSARALVGAPRVEASFADLVRKEGAGRVQNPRTLALEAGSPYDDERVLQWLPMTRLRDGESVLVPASWWRRPPATCRARRRPADGSRR